MINGRFAVASLTSSSAGMPPELVEEFPEGHKEAAEHHKDRGDPPDRTEPLLLEMGQKENSCQDLRKSDGEALRRRRLPRPAVLLQNQFIAESVRWNRLLG